MTIPATTLRAPAPPAQPTRVTWGCGPVARMTRPNSHLVVAPLGSSRGIFFQPERYVAAFARVAARAKGRAREALLPFLHDGPRFARCVAAAVADGSYRPRPATLHTVRLDKERVLFQLDVVDRVVHDVVAQILVEAMEPRLSPHLWSYRAGRSALGAVRGLRDVLRAHCRERPDPRTRGLHVLRCDVAAYGDSIPMDEGSPLWGDLAEVLGEVSPLVAGVVRPPVLGADGRIAPVERGVPTGSPMATALANLYLMRLDRELGEIPGAFYARYGDDLCLAHPDAAVVDEAERALRAHLAGRGLALNERKRVRSFWNGAGRGEGGTRHVTFLGIRLGWDGALGLPRSKARELLGEVRRRLGQAVRLAEPAERLAAARDAVADALDPRSPLAAPHVATIFQRLDDREQLAALDELVRLAAAESLSGRRGVRAFRELPPRRLALSSLVAQRNR